MSNQLVCPCEACQHRRIMSYLNSHVWGDDCNIDCEEYEFYKTEMEKREINSDSNERS